MIAIPKLISVGLLSVGVFILVQVILPIISFQIWTIGQKNNQVLINPGSSGQVLGVSLNGVSVRNKDRFPAFISTLSRETKANYQEFQISIPKIKLENTRVIVDSNDLANSLAHLPGSALPGEKGNVFVSGHSALSPIFSLKKALFSNLTDLKKGDKIEVMAGGTKFVYQVIDLKVVDPGDLSVISPPDLLNRYISLMTCVPPGLNFKRLIVLGKMI